MSLDFATRVKAALTSVLDVEDLPFQIKSGYLRTVIENCFTLQCDSVETKAEVILSTLFSLLTGSSGFAELLQRIDDEQERNRYLSELLYRIYYNDLRWEHLVDRRISLFYFFQILAAKASQETIQAIWVSFSSPQKVQCVIALWRCPDEGAYQIFRVSRSDQEVDRLQVLVENGFVSIEEVDQSITELEELVHTRVKACAARFAKKGVHYPVKAWEAFFEVFGFYGLQMPKSFGSLSTTKALDEVLEESEELLVEVSKHLHALSHAPEQYCKGLESMVLAMPTCGKDLSREAWLPSVIASLKKLCLFLGISLHDHPIFVFDQSEPSLFALNRAYIETLQQEHGATVVHLDREAITAYAKKLHIEDLIVTTSSGQFGFGGARNSVFLLAPMLKQLHLHKEASLETVLESKYAVHMGDDDVHLPVSTLFSDALFTYHHRDEYFCRIGLVVGRKTVEVFGSLDLAHIMRKPEDIVLQSRWEDRPFFHGMAGLLSKPKICLNIPHGQEEGSCEAMQKYLFDVRKPLIHLAGARYPKGHLPTNRFSGLAPFLQQQNGYVLQLLQINDLIDPFNLHKRCALPWNTKQDPFTSLSDGIQYITQPETSAEMQKRFWNNFAWFLTGFTSPESEASSTLLEHFINQDFDEEHYPAEAREIVHQFAQFRQDIVVCKEFSFLLTGKDVEQAKEAIERTYGEKIEHFPVTYALYLVCRSVGLSQFQQALRTCTRT